MGTIGTWLTTPTNQGRLGDRIGTWVTTPMNQSRLGYTIFCSFFLYLSFLYNNKSCRMQKKISKFQNSKKPLKTQNFEKSHFTFFAHFFFIYLFCIIIKAVKCKKKISKF